MATINGDGGRAAAVVQPQTLTIVRVGVLTRAGHDAQERAHALLEDIKHRQQQQQQQPRYRSPYGRRPNHKASHGVAQ